MQGTGKQFARLGEMVLGRAYRLRCVDKVLLDLPFES